MGASAIGRHVGEAMSTVASKKAGQTEQNRFSAEIAVMMRISCRLVEVRIVTKKRKDQAGESNTTSLDTLGRQAMTLTSSKMHLTCNGHNWMGICGRLRWPVPI